MSASVVVVAMLCLAQMAPEELSQPPLPAPVPEPSVSSPAPAATPAPSRSSPPPAAVDAPPPTRDGARGPSLADRQGQAPRQRGFFDFERTVVPILLVSEFVAGAVSGGIAGARLSGGDPGYVLLGAVLGGPLLAFGSMAYLYAAPENIAGVSLLASLAGGLAALGLAYQQQWDVGTGIIAVTLGANLGLLTVFLATLPVSDLSDADVALMRGVMVNSTSAAAVVLLLLSSLGRDVRWSTLTFVPAAGLIAGGVLSAFVDLPLHREYFFTAIPTIGAAFIGGMVYTVMSKGFREPNVGPAPAIVTGASFAGLLALSFVLGERAPPTGAGAEPRRRGTRPGEGWAVSPWVLPAGARGTGVSVGASAFTAF